MNDAAGEGAAPRESLWGRAARSVGPALIVACVVVGPGSILTSSKVGCQFGYEMIWLLVSAGVLMVGAIAAAAHVGVAFSDSPCTELTRRVGRPIALLAGLSVFLITACFQFSNNLGVLAALAPLVDSTGEWSSTILVALNVALILCLFGFRHLYVPVERIMMGLVALMLIGFAANLLFSMPSPTEILAGLIPRLPEDLAEGFLPRMVRDASGEMQLVDPWLVIQGLLLTNFSIAGAFYQAYLVKEKGWTAGNLRQGLVDSAVGAAVLVFISLMIMITSAAQLYGKIEPDELRTITDVARQLEPMFGAAAKWLFCLGVLAAAISSFLVNSMIGGAMLADGLGLKASIDSVWSRLFTTVVLLSGMGVALGTDSQSRVPLIIFAQAMTVLGGPVLVLSLDYLLWRSKTDRQMRPAWWIVGLMAMATVVVFLLAIRTGWRLIGQW